MQLQTCVFLLFAGPLAGSYPARAQGFDLGVLGGVRVTDDLGGGFSVPAHPESKRYAAGPALNIHLPRHFSVEFDALYQRFGFTSRFDFPSIARERANSWEFPLLLKYRLASSPILVGAGYAPRIVDGNDVLTLGAGTTRSFSTNYPVTHGVVVSGGLEFKTSHVRVSPEVRYVHWNAPFLFNATPDTAIPLASKQDEVFVLIGIAWRHTHGSQ